MSTKTRRLPKEGPRLSRMTNWLEVAKKQEAFNRELLEIVNGLPAGFYPLPPLIIEGGAAATPGVQGDGWSAGTHRHALNTAGIPGLIVGAVAAQGAGPGVTLNGHTHPLPPEIEEAMALAFLGL